MWESSIYRFDKVVANAEFNAQNAATLYQEEITKATEQIKNLK